MGLEIIWNIHRKSLRQKGIDLLTSGKGKFGLRKMAEKIRTCGRRRIDGGHNIGSNIAVLDFCLRSGDVTSSYSGNISSSSSLHQQRRNFRPKIGLRKKRKKKKVERRILKVLIHKELKEEYQSRRFERKIYGRFFSGYYFGLFQLI